MTAGWLPCLLPLGADLPIGFDDLAIVVFFVVVAILRLIRGIASKRKTEGGSPPTRRVPRPSPEGAEHRGHGEHEREEEEEDEELVFRRPPVRPAPPPLPAPTRGSSEGAARRGETAPSRRGSVFGEASDVSSLGRGAAGRAAQGATGRRGALPPTEALAGARQGPRGRDLLLAERLEPRDRMRQAILWTEVLRPHRPLSIPPRRPGSPREGEPTPTPTPRT